MERNLARIVKIDSVGPIEGADAIEVAFVGGWPVVVKKNEYAPGDLAIYFEIDAFLPEGNPAWQFLVDKSSRMYDGRRGHVLRSVKLRGQVSQGLLLGLAALEGTPHALSSPEVGVNVAQDMGVVKYEPPVPACLAGVARGAFPLAIPKTDQERIQNLGTELAGWLADGTSWEVSEKLEGSSCTVAWLEGELHVCSRNLNLLETEGNSFWQVTRALGLDVKLPVFSGTRNLALQGELVGFGIQGNIYGLNGQQFYLYDVYDADERRYLSADEREEVAHALDLPHVPVIHAAFDLASTEGMADVLTMADGISVLKAGVAREGLVFKALGEQVSFKAISNKYLLKQKS